MRKTDQEIKEKMDKRLQHYNKMIDFCMDMPRRKYEIDIEFEGIVDSKRITCMLMTLCKREMMTSWYTSENKQIREYKSVPGARYFHAPKEPVKTKSTYTNKLPDKIIIEGNKTTVSCGVYHTKGNAHKRSAWIGSSMGAIE